MKSLQHKGLMIGVCAVAAVFSGAVIINQQDALGVTKVTQSEGVIFTGGRSQKGVLGGAQTLVDAVKCVFTECASKTQDKS